MRLPVKYLFLFLLCCFVFVQCRDSSLPDDAFAYIPQHTTSVTAFNPDKLMEKAVFEEVKQLDFYRDMLREVSQDNPAFAQVLEDPAAAGVDLSQNVYISLTTDPETFQPLIAILFSIDDKAAFESTLDKLQVQYVPASRTHGYLSGHSTALVWNDQVGIMGMGPDQTNIQAQVEAYLQTKSRKSASRIKPLRQALAEEYDVMMWWTAEQIVQQYQLDKLGKAFRFSAEDLRDNAARTLLNFEAGQVRGEVDWYLSDKISNDLKLVLQEELDTDFRDVLPSENLVMLSTMALNLPGINQLLIEYHVQGSSETPLRPYGFAWEDVRKALSGEIAIAAYQDTGLTSMSIPQFLVALDVQDRTALQELLTAGKTAGWLQELSADRYQWTELGVLDSLGNEQYPVMAQMWLDDDMLYLSDRDELIKMLQAGGYATGTGLLAGRQEQKEPHAYSFLLDAAQFSRMEDDMPSMPFSYMQAAGDMEKAEGTAHFQDQDQNSLRQFFQWLNNMYQQRQDLERRLNEKSS